MNFKEIYESIKTIAVYGMSTNPEKPSNSVPAFLKDKGFKVIPINPRAEEINGDKAYDSIHSVQDKIDVLNIFRPSDEIPEITKKAIERKNATGDIRIIWCQLGIVNDEAKKMAEDNNITFIQDHCMLQEYKNHMGG
ncbi:MAG: CoA-binding protein [Candidatus Kapaibacterium sp.]